MSFDKYIPEKIRQFTPYTPSLGNYRIRLDANESPYDLPHALVEEAVSAAALNRYPDAYASKLCGAFAKRYSVCVDNVVAGNGSDELIMLITSAFTEKNDSIAVAVPDFSMYSFYSELLENRVCFFEKDSEYRLDTDAFADFINENKCKMALLSNPCNPTGIGIDKKTIRRFIEKTDALVILDEAYMDFWDESLLDCVTEYDNLIILKTLSKLYGAASIRVGFAVAQRAAVNVIKTAKSPYNVNTISQNIGKAILEQGELIDARLASIKANTARIYNFLLEKGIKVYPTSTNFVFCETPEANGYYDRLKENGIIIRRFSDRLLRISAGSDSETDELMRCF